MSAMGRLLRRLGGAPPAEGEAGEGFSAADPAEASEELHQGEPGPDDSAAPYQPSFLVRQFLARARAEAEAATEDAAEAVHDGDGAYDAAPQARTEAAAPQAAEPAAPPVGAPVGGRAVPPAAGAAVRPAVPRRSDGDGT